MIHYTDQIHKDTLLFQLKRLDKIRPTGTIDREYLSALYIITSDDELRCKCLPFVDNEGIDFNEILEKQDFSGGYNPLIRLASNLFNENYGVTPMELITKTDD